MSFGPFHVLPSQRLLLEGDRSLRRHCDAIDGYVWPNSCQVSIVERMNASNGVTEDRVIWTNDEMTSADPCADMSDGEQSSHPGCGQPATGQGYRAVDGGDERP